MEEAIRREDRHGADCQGDRGIKGLLCFSEPQYQVNSGIYLGVRMGPLSDHSSVFSLDPGHVCEDSLKCKDKTQSAITTLMGRVVLKDN